MQIGWSHVYAKIHHRKIPTLTALEGVETALMVAGQLGINTFLPHFSVRIVNYRPSFSIDFHAKTIAHYKRNLHDVKRQMHRVEKVFSLFKTKSTESLILPMEC